MRKASSRMTRVSETDARGASARRRKVITEEAAAAADEDPIELWETYKRTPTEALRNQLVERYLPIVRYTAERLASTLPQSVELDDLMSSGLFGLFEAIKSFDLSRKIKFKTYASWRVRGAILDDLRANDWVPRLVRNKATLLDQKMREAEAAFGRPATDLELATMLQMSVAELDKLMQDASAVTVCYLSDSAGDGQDASARSELLEDAKTVDPIDDIQRRDVLQVVMQELCSRDKLIMMLYYFEEMTMREIGLTLDLSESRVCQLHSRIVARLKAKLGDRKKELVF
jgi:RNA polymerase sigma factor for flagellar operon FliA